MVGIRGAIPLQDNDAVFYYLGVSSTLARNCYFPATNYPPAARVRIPFRQGGWRLGEGLTLALDLPVAPMHLFP